MLEEFYFFAAGCLRRFSCRQKVGVASTWFWQAERVGLKLLSGTPSVGFSLVLSFFLHLGDADELLTTSQ